MNKKYPILYKNTSKYIPLNELQESYLYSRLLFGKEKTISFTYTEFKINQLDVTRLEVSWNKIIRTYPILRAQFSENGKMHIHYFKQYKIKESVIDDTFNEKYLETYRKENIEKLEYDLMRYPLYHLEVTQFIDCSIIHFWIDSIIMDGVSAKKILHQWKCLYENPEFVLQEEPISFDDYNFSILKFKKENPIYQEHVSYWINKINHTKDIGFHQYNANHSNIRHRLSCILSKEALSVFLKKNKINPSTYFLYFFEKFIVEFNNYQSCAYIMTISNRYLITENINDVIGVLSSTMLQVASKDESADLISSLKTRQENLFQDMNWLYSSSINVLRKMDKKNITIPFVFTYKKEFDQLSFSSNQIYSITQTPGIYLECVITEYSKQFSVECYVVEDYFKEDIKEQFHKYILNLQKISSFSKAITLSALQTSYMKERIQKNKTGALYKIFYLGQIKIDKYLHSLNQFLSAYSYEIDLQSGELIPAKKEAVFHKYEYAKIDDFLKHRQKTIDFMEGNVNHTGYLISFIKCQNDLYVEICLDMILFNGHQALEFINKLLKKLNVQSALYRNPLRIQLAYDRPIREQRYAVSLIECNLIRHLHQKIMVLPIVIYSVLHVLCKWFPDSSHEIALVQFGENKKGNGQDDTKLSYFLYDENTYSHQNVASIVQMIDTITKQGREKCHSIPDIAITDCQDIVLDNHGEIEQLSYASTPNIKLDVVVYKTSYGINLEFNALKSFLTNDHLQIISTQVKSLLKETLLHEKRWKKMKSDEAFEYKNLMKNFLDNNHNKLDFTDFRKVLYDWNDTKHLFDRNMTIVDFFTESVKKVPGNIAVRSNQGEYTYAELDENSNRIAHYLKSEENMSNLVGVYMERNENLIAAILGILKAGKAYLPFNTSDPDERIHNIIEKANLEILLTDKKNMDKKVFDSLKKNKVEDILASTAAIIEYKNSQIQSIDLAYVIFTSGSTGSPKGVGVNHRAVVNLLEWAIRKFEFNQEDCAAFVNPINFDLSVFDIFGLLAVGGTIRMINDNDRKDPFTICKIINNERITFWNSAPAYLGMIAPVLEQEEPSKNMRHIFLSGDWIPMELVRKMKKKYPGAVFVSLGGATEATVWSNYYIVDEINPVWNSIPYGKPIDNSMYYILDSKLNPVGIREQGELYISGECLSIGYYHSEQLTKERFLYNPYSDEYPIMYKTGDLASYYEDGNIEFLGRADNQVKIRGYRVELGELESVMKKNGFSSCAAIVIQEEIYACAEYGEQLEELKNNQLNKSFIKQLPEYMNPKKVIAIPQFPYTENGKVDRKEIVEIVRQFINKKTCSSKTKEEYTRNINKILADLISETIEHDIGEQTNFDEIGMNSLQYTMLSVKIKDKTGLEINPMLFYKYTSINEMASYMETLKEKNRIANLDSITPEPGTVKKEQDVRSDVSIIAMEYEFPTIKNKPFQEVVFQGLNCVSTIPKNRWDTEKQQESQVKYGNFIKNIEKFDPMLFHISPREAELMDPRQRLLLQAIWNLIEKAGYHRKALKGKRVGVFIGATGDEYYNICREKCVPISELSLIGTSKTVLANRISYFFDWKGPSEVIDTACSSSLVAVHRAVRALKDGECDLAVAGGINLILDPLPHHSLNKTGMLSPDGVCKTFDERGNGYGRGEGFGVILLKMTEQALQDHDCVLAHVLATKTNHGGRANALTAPNPKAQTVLIKSALEEAKIDMNSIQYIETHGTGTQLGDPIEITGITDAFKQFSKEHHIEWKQNIYLGAVKANIGHLEAASGIAGLIKMVLCMKYGLIAPVANFNTVNPKIDLSDEHLMIPVQKVPWKDQRKIGSVSAFGFGGTNAHIILESGVNENGYSQLKNNYLLPLSAQTPELLDAYLDDMRRFLKNCPCTEGVLEKSMLMRTQYSCRICIFYTSLEELIAKLDNIKEKEDQNQKVYYGNGIKDSEKVINLKNEKKEYFKNLTSEEKAQLWCWGIDAALQIENTCSVLWNIPVSPFKQKDYWFDSAYKKQEIKTVYMDKIGKVIISGNEQFLHDHIIHGQKVVPGAMYLEYALHIMKKNKGVIRDITWFTTISHQDFPMSFVVGTRKNQESRELLFKNGEETVFSCHLSDQDPGLPVKPITVDSYVNKMTLTQDCIYSRFQNNHINYGRTFRILERAYVVSNHAFGTFQRSPVNMSYIDGIFQLVILMHSDENFMPFYMQRLTFCDELKKAYYGYVEKVSSKDGKMTKFNGMLLGKNGECIANFEGYSGRQNKKKVKKDMVIEEKYVPVEVERTLNNRQTYVWDMSSANIHEINGQDMYVPLNGMEQVMEAINHGVLNRKNFILILPENTKSFEQIIKHVFEVIQRIVSKNLCVNFILINQGTQVYFRSIKSSLAAFGKSAAKETNTFKFKYIACDKTVSLSEIDQIINEVINRNHCEFRFNDQGKLEEKTVDFYKGAYRSLKIDKAQYYLITGGNGSIAQKIKNYLVKSGGIPVMLSRNPQKESKYYSIKADVSQKEELEYALHTFISHHGMFKGIFHLAGSTCDKMLVFKRYNDFRETLHPKVDGTMHLLDFIKSHNYSLDFFISFSSIVSITGNLGQADYAMANRFLDNIASSTEFTNHIGILKAINWCYWETGGMKIDSKRLNKMIKETGLSPIKDEQAMELLFHHITSGNGNQIMAAGDETKVIEYLNKG